MAACVYVHTFPSTVGSYCVIVYFFLKKDIIDFIPFVLIFEQEGRKEGGGGIFSEESLTQYNNTHIKHDMQYTHAYVNIHTLGRI
jgi:hypothetical protein